ncbi:sigma-70 family RNA polymerase sigma factor [Aquimarina addita]|uniref:Sigma-70 family RNA polymerase sigma factor n=1 Tax=Aquimarina addita TaxID=870485 RepID=A0ABP6UUG3_9FLAO
MNLIGFNTSLSIEIDNTMDKKIFDSLLVLQYQSGNKKAAGLLVKRWHKKLCKQAYWYTNDIDAAKDIAQDSWTTILTKINNLKEPNRFGNWALTIVNRKSIDWLRKNEKELINRGRYMYETNISNTETNTVDDTKYIITQLKNVIKELSIDQQIVLNLFYLESYNIKEISEIIDVSPGTVKSRLFTAREKLKQIFKNRNYEK